MDRRGSAGQTRRMAEPKRSMVVRIWREHLSRYAGQLGLAFLFMIGLALAEVGFVLGTEWIFAGLEPGRSERFRDVQPDDVMRFGPVLVMVLALAQAGFFYLQAIFAQGVGVKVLRDLQERMYGAIIRYDLAQLKGRGEADRKIGNLVSRFTNDMTVLRETLNRVPNAARDIVRLVGFIGVLAFLDVVLFLCVLLIYPFIGLPITVIGKAIRRLARQVQGQIGDLTGILSESLAGQETIKSYNLQAHENARMKTAFEERRTLLARLIRLRALNEPVITVISSMAIAVIIGIAAYRIGVGLLTGPELVAFLIAMALLSQPARGLGTLNAVLQEGLAALERVFSVIDETPKIVGPSNPSVLKVLPGEAPALLFKDVRFAYEHEKPILRGFDLEVPAGATAALVGPSGAGKSTVFGLLTRFYDSQAGTVSVAGQDVRDLDLAELRGAVSLVTQTPVLFDMTVEENIRLGKLGASREAIEEAARSAAAHDFITALPQGYATRVGEGGSALSGGERQRIALARAFLKDAPILLLDEATSALDAESERLIEEAMIRLRRGRTTLVIAHRLSTIRDADVIAVMQHGQVIEEGDHEVLLQRGGLYAKLVALQDRQPQTS
jgi:subfamily B ATP-binding cassette protein MsbA